MAFELVPYSNFHDLNLDWILKQFPLVYEAKDKAVSAGEAAEQAKDDAVSAKDDAVSAMTTAVQAKNDAVSARNNAAISANAAAASLNAIGTATSGAVADWLEQHVDPDTGYVIDNSLTISGAAADAKETGVQVKGIRDFWVAKPGVVTWTQGGLNQLTGAEEADTTRVRSGYIETQTGLSIHISGVEHDIPLTPDMTVWVFTYSSQTDTDFVKVDGPYSDDFDSFVPAGYYFRIMAGRADNSTVTPSDINAVDYTTYEYTDTAIYPSLIGTPGKAPDSYSVGKAISDVYGAIPSVDNTLTIPGAAADAFITGNTIYYRYVFPFNGYQLANSSYPSGWRNGYFNKSNGQSSTSASYSRNRIELPHITNAVFIGVTAPSSGECWVSVFSAYPNYSNGADNSAIFVDYYQIDAGDSESILYDPTKYYIISADVAYANIENDPPQVVFGVQLAPGEINNNLYSLFSDYPPYLGESSFRSQGGTITGNRWYCWGIHGDAGTESVFHCYNLDTGLEYGIPYEYNDLTFVNGNHLNDMTYNPVEDCLYIATDNPTNTIVKMTNGERPKFANTIEIKDSSNNSITACSICYNRKDDKYYVINDSYTKLYVFNSSWVRQAEYTITDPLSSYTGKQGIDTDGTFIYAVKSNTSSQNAVITFDLLGNVIEVTTIPYLDTKDAKYEMEGISYDWDTGGFVVNCQDKTPGITRTVLMALLPNTDPIHTSGLFNFKTARMAVMQPF